MPRRRVFHLAILLCSFLALAASLRLPSSPRAFRAVVQDPDRADVTKAR